MSPNTIKIINDITSVPNKLRESFILNNYPDFHNKVLEFINDNNLPDNIKFKEKLWYFINDIKDTYLCICGCNTSFNRKFTDGYKRFCSSKCAQKDQQTKDKRRKTTISKYGVDNVAKLDCVKKKIEDTNIKKYGYKSSFQNIDVRNKWKMSIMERYGVDHVFKVDSIKDKIVKTNLERYGVEYFVQSDNYISKLISTNLKKYGVRFYQHSGEYRDKTSITNKKKYGHKYFISSKEFSEKTKETLDKLGVEFTSQLQSTINKNKGIFKDKRIKRYKELGFLIVKYGGGESIELKDINICNHEFTISKQLLRKRLRLGKEICTICNSVVNSVSEMELELRRYIESIYSGDIINNSRGIIGNVELDIYIPKLKIAIEFNGLYWHSELFKDKKYHLRKLKMCEDLGIELLHIFEDDWLYKSDIVKSIIKNRLGLNNKKIYARKCNIRGVNSVDSREFLEDNHIQGYSNSKYKLGLYFKNELVSIMTFSKRYINGRSEMELVRFCSKININVIGGSSKLFNHFVKNFKDSYEYIRSYADISMFSGNLYKSLGFEYIHRSPPNYYWVVDNIRKHRFNYNKAKLVKEGYDINKTEREIMNMRGYYRIWGCGQDLYIYKKKFKN